MSGKTELDEASLTDLLTVQIMGCLGMCRKHLGESDEEWCRFQGCFDLFLKAGYQGIIQNKESISTPLAKKGHCHSSVCMAFSTNCHAIGCDILR